ncbi:hypothetical protein GQR58_030702 [Nymphon striatum]|nr:hypothetical protein GQR58_030702 [Nymphon striatum]
MRSLARNICHRWQGVVMVSAAYNAGPARPPRWMKNYGDPRKGDIDIVDWVEMVPFRETQNYIMRVTESLPVYRARLGKDPLPIPFSQELIGNTLKANNNRRTDRDVAADHFAKNADPDKRTKGQLEIGKGLHRAGLCHLIAADQQPVTGDTRECTDRSYRSSRCRSSVPKTCHCNGPRRTRPEKAGGGCILARDKSGQQSIDCEHRGRQQRNDRRRVKNTHARLQNDDYPDEANTNCHPPPPPDVFAQNRPRQCGDQQRITGENRKAFNQTQYGKGRNHHANLCRQKHTAYRLQDGLRGLGRCTHPTRVTPRQRDDKCRKEPIADHHHHQHVILCRQMPRETVLNRKNKGGHHHQRDAQRNVIALAHADIRATVIDTLNQEPGLAQPSPDKPCGGIGCCRSIRLAYGSQLPALIQATKARGSWRAKTRPETTRLPCLANVAGFRGHRLQSLRHAAPAVRSVRLGRAMPLPAYPVCHRTRETPDGRGAYPPAP